MTRFVHSFSSSRRAACALLMALLAVVSLSAGEPAGDRRPTAARNEESPEMVTNSIGMRFVKIPAGEFLMGSAADDPAAADNEKPAHRVIISRPFYLGVHEVTQAQYEQVMGENPSWFAPDGPGRRDVAGLDTANHPVDRVSWEEAVEFCRRLSALPAERAAGRVYCLPTEAEWEYACRAGTTTSFHTGESLTPAAACIRAASTEPASKSHAPQVPRSTRPVGSFPPNAFGLYDMHGNVWEWCADWYDPDYYARAPKLDPAGPETGTGKVVRGGAWNFDASYARSAHRDFTRATRRDIGNGVRIGYRL